MQNAAVLSVIELKSCSELLRLAFSLWPPVVDSILFFSPTMHLDSAAVQFR